jgi:hypothetical protein
MSVDRRGILGFAALAGSVMLGAEPRAAARQSGGRGSYFIEDDCAKLLMRFFYRLDALNRLNAAVRTDRSTLPAATEEEDPWALMTADGAWRRNSATIDSRTAFAKAISDLPAGLITAHLVCNLIVDAKSETSAAASFRLLIFSATAENGAIPVKLGPPGAILTTRAELSMNNGSWRIRHIGSDAVFHF